MNTKDVVIYFLPEEIYFVLTTIYLFFLNHLNKELKATSFENSFMLLHYQDNMPIKYFIIALFLFVAGGLILLNRFNRIRNYECRFWEMILAIIGMTLVIIFLILIFHFINNPILRAIMTTVFVGACIISAITKS